MFVKCVEGRAGYKQIPGKVISGSPDTLLVRLYTLIYTDIQIYTHIFRHRYWVHRDFQIHRYSNIQIDRFAYIQQHRY